MKHRQNGFGVVGILIAVVIIVGIGATGLTFAKRSAVKHDSATGASAAGSTAKTNADTPPRIAKVKGAEVDANAYYSLTLNVSSMATGNRYYGKIQAINASYIRLYPTYYDNSAGTLVLLGSELHAPDPVMYIRQSSVESISRLDTTDAHYTAILASQKATPVASVRDAYPSATPDYYINSQRYQAVFFDDGQVYFGKLVSVTGNTLFKSPAQVFTFQTSGTQATLVKADPAKVAGYKYSQILFWENIHSDGRVAKALDQYLKQNP